jgi:hypothetical protein
MWTKRLVLVFLAACGGGGDDGDPPLAEVQTKLEKLAVNDTSIFAVDTKDGKIIELGLADGAMIGKLPSTGAVSELAAQGNWVAWIEAEGTGKLIVRRRADGTVESNRASTNDPKILATSEGLFYSDGSLVAIWLEGTNPDRVATTGTSAKVIGVDTSFVYTTEQDTSVVKYPRAGDMSDVVMPTSKDATVKDGQIAHRVPEGIRERDLTTGFDRIVGAPPADYACTLLIAGRAVMCGKYRAIDGMITELLSDPVGGYAAVGKNVVWIKTDGSTSTIFRVDAELAK